MADSSGRTSQAETLRPVLEEAHSRLIALARSLDDSTLDPNAIRQTAVDLERVVHRVHWVADVAAEETSAIP